MFLDKKKVKVKIRETKRQLLSFPPKSWVKRQIRPAPNYALPKDEFVQEEKKKPEKKKTKQGKICPELDSRNPFPQHPDRPTLMLFVIVCVLMNINNGGIKAVNQ